MVSFQANSDMSVMAGGIGKKQRATGGANRRPAADQPRIIVATGRYLYL
jgi:hypothetical protein